MLPLVEPLIWGGAFVVTLWMAAARAARAGLDPWSMYLAGLLGVFGALWGGSLFAQAMAGHGMDVMRLFAGEKSMFGACIGAAAASGGFLLWRRQPLLAYADGAVPGIFAGYVLMRVVCFIDGHCYGVVTDLPWAARFPRGTEVFADHLVRGWVAPEAALSLPVHPTQLYHAALGAVALLVLLRLRAHAPGGALAAGLMLYGAGRFGIEFLRGDAVPVIGPLDVNHIAALVMFVAGTSLGRSRTAFVAVTRNKQTA